MFNLLLVLIENKFTYCSSAKSPYTLTESSHLCSSAVVGLSGNFSSWAKLSCNCSKLSRINSQAFISFPPSFPTYTFVMVLLSMALDLLSSLRIDSDSRSIIKGYLMHRDQLMHNHHDVFALPSGCLCSKAAFNTSQATIFLLPAISFPNWCRIGSPLRHVLVGKSSTKRKYYLI